MLDGLTSEFEGVGLDGGGVADTLGYVDELGGGGADDGEGGDACGLHGCELCCVCVVVYWSWV